MIDTEPMQCATGQTVIGSSFGYDVDRLSWTHGWLGGIPLYAIQLVSRHLGKPDIVGLRREELAYQTTEFGIIVCRLEVHDQAPHGPTVVLNELGHPDPIWVIPEQRQWLG